MSLPIFGLLHLSFWGNCLAAVILTQITIVTVTVYLHRSQSHRALDCHPILSHFFRFWAWLTTGMVTKEWVAIHRKHHAKCETSEDPHSPQILGIKKVLLEGAELYRDAAKDTEMLERYGHGTPDDWLERHIYTPYHFVGLGVMFLIDIILFGVAGISIWGFQMLWIPLVAAGIVNGIGHYCGYRNYECTDAARNFSPWGIIIGGEELHNNHHAYATSAKLSNRWWEIDTGWFWIKLFSLIKLARVKHLPPRLILEKNKNDVDLETVKALINNRLQIMVNYKKAVIIPVLREEKRKAREAGQRFISRAKALLSREKILMDEKARHRLNELLTRCESLETIYQFKLKLQAIWERTTASQKELIEALQEWCRQAEASGLSVLKDFARQMQGYKLAMV